MKKNLISVANHNSYDEWQSGCFGKQEITIDKINKIKKERSFSKKKRELAYYKCKFCEYYHLTSRKKK